MGTLFHWIMRNACIPVGGLGTSLGLPMEPLHSPRDPLPLFHKKPGSLEHLRLTWALGPMNAMGQRGPNRIPANPRLGS